MLELLPEPQFQRLIFLGHVRVLVQIVPEVQFIVIPGIAKMHMEDLFCKSLFRVSAIERYPSCLSRHQDKAVLLECLCGPSHIRAFGYLDQHIDDILCPYSGDGRASDVADALNRALGQRLFQKGLDFVVISTLLFVMLDKEYGKQLP